MIPYRMGYNFECRVRDWLRDHGWVVFRTGGSRWPVDLVAMKADQTVLIQCRASGRLSPREREELGFLGALLLVRVVMASREGTGLTFRKVRPDGTLMDGQEDTPEMRKEDYGDRFGSTGQGKD